VPSISGFGEVYYIHHYMKQFASDVRQSELARHNPCIKIRQSLHRL